MGGIYSFAFVSFDDKLKNHRINANEGGVFTKHRSRP
jgi:hypothetical protein